MRNTSSRPHFVSVTLIAVAFVAAILSVPHFFEPTAQSHDKDKAATAAAPVPRLADGHPDFSGFYDRDIFHGDPNQELAGQHFINRASDGNIFYDYAGANEAQLHTATEAELKNPPPYKPEYWQRSRRSVTAYGGNDTCLDP